MTLSFHAEHPPPVQPSSVSSTRLAVYMVKAFFFCFGSLFCSTPLARCFFLLVLFDLFERIFDQLCFFDGFFLLVLFGQLCSFDGFLFSYFSGQLRLLKALSYSCFLVFLEGFLLNFVFWMVTFWCCYLISFTLLMTLCLAFSI